MLDSRKGGTLAHFILLAAAAMGELQTTTRGMAPAIDYDAPRFGRRNYQRTSTGPGKSPALSGPHSERQVHVRARDGKQHWMTAVAWQLLPRDHFRRPGDVIEHVNGYGQVTSRHRVQA